MPCGWGAPMVVEPCGAPGSLVAPECMAWAAGARLDMQAAASLWRARARQTAGTVAGGRLRPPARCCRIAEHDSGRTPTTTAQAEDTSSHMTEREDESAP